MVGRRRGKTTFLLALRGGRVGFVTKDGDNSFVGCKRPAEKDSSTWILVGDWGEQYDNVLKKT